MTTDYDEFRAKFESLVDQIWRESQSSRTTIHDAGIMQDIAGRIRAVLDDGEGDGQ